MKAYRVWLKGGEFAVLADSPNEAKAMLDSTLRRMFPLHAGDMQCFHMEIGQAVRDAARDPDPDNPYVLRAAPKVAGLAE